MVDYDIGLPITETSVKDSQPLVSRRTLRILRSMETFFLRAYYACGRHSSALEDISAEKVAPLVQSFLSGEQNRILAALMLEIIALTCLDDRSTSDFLIDLRLLCKIYTKAVDILIPKD